MTDLELKTLYENAVSKTDFIKKLNLDTRHKNGGYIDRIIMDILQQINITNKDDISGKAFKLRYKERLKNEYYTNVKYCKECGNEISFERRNSDFCSEHCGKAYGNKHRIITNETKEKISNSVTKYLIDHKRLKTNKEKIDKYRTCIVCGKQFLIPVNAKNRYSAAKTCCKECHHILVSNTAKEVIRKCKENGTFQSWTTCNIESYPEKFWKNVLENNNIKYIFNHHFDKYFLDFYIEHNNVKIDLEIDGKQHKYADRQLSDAIRDEYIKSQNIIVYRIDWNEINTENGSNLMKEKINKFIDFYNNLP